MLAARLLGLLTVRLAAHGLVRSNAESWAGRGVVLIVAGFLEDGHMYIHMSIQMSTRSERCSFCEHATSCTQV